MSLSFRSTQVSAPTTSPTLSIGGTDFFIRHRRVNLDGQHSLWSDAVEFSGASVTITPESYSDSTQLLRDEFLYSEDDTTYYIIPRSGTLTGAQTVTTFTPLSWTVAVNEDNQNSALSELDFGSFTTSSSPFKRLYVLNSGLSVGSLTFNFIDALTTEVASQFSGLIQVEIEGVFSEFSQAPTTTYNASFIWQSPPQNLNTLGLIFPTNSFVQVKVTLLNFPLGGLIENTISLSMQVQENLRVFPLSYDSDWALNTFLYDPSKGFDFPFIEASNSGLTVTVKPFLINVNGVLIGRFINTTFTLSDVGDHYITLSANGVLQIWDSTETIPSNLLVIADITTLNSSPLFLSSHVLYVSPRPSSFGYDPTLTGIANKVIEYDQLTETVVVSSGGSDSLGVALGANSSLYATSGIVLVETEETTLIKGDNIGASDGLAVLDSEGGLKAIQDEFLGYILCETRFIKPSPTPSIDFQGVYNSSAPDPEIITVAGALSVRTVTDSDPAFQVKNLAETVTFSVTGNGLVTTTDLTVTNTIQGTIENGALITNGLDQFAATTSAELASIITDETGSGSLVFANSPTLVTPTLGTPASGTLTNCTGLPLSGVTGLNDTLTSRNIIVNGDFVIDQYNSGSAQTIIAGVAKVYPIDRWYAYCTGANVTGQQVAGSGDALYRYRFTGAASNTAIQFGQRVEAANSAHFNNHVTTFSVDLANSLLTTVTWTAYYANTKDTFGTIASPTRTLIATGTFTVSSTLTRYSTQVTIPSAATTGIEIVLSVANQTSGTWTIGDIQWELGSVATPFEREDISITTTKCQWRYREIDWFFTIARNADTIQFYPITFPPMASAPISTPTGFIDNDAAGTTSANLYLPTRDSAAGFQLTGTVVLGSRILVTTELSCEL